MPFYLILSRDLGYGETSELRNQVEEISKMLTSYTQKIRNDR
jgi:hypothetical protein